MISTNDSDLERWMREYGPSLKRTCYLYLKDVALAEDAAQETFVKAWRSFSTFRGDCSEKTWLIRIAVNTCRDMLRSAWFRRMDRRVTPEELPLTAPSKDEQPQLAEAIMALAPKYREVIILYYYQGLDTQEMALAVRTSVNTAKSRLFRARKLLREQLEGAWKNEGIL